ncbi:hypothetical protein B0H11DRAFT_538931 [Mycena galericulata]|nr:hypothetical protein B0H11DRAFT_538931 [Mycena galericulata]
MEPLVMAIQGDRAGRRVPRSSAPSKGAHQTRDAPAAGHPVRDRALRNQLARVQRNEASLLHAGDCAESFDACTHPRPCGPHTRPGASFEHILPLTTTLNHIRALLGSGFASLHHPREWSLAHVRNAAVRKEFEQIVSGLSDALDFSRTIGVVGSEAGTGGDY